MGVAAPIYLHMLQVERAKRLEAEQKLANRYGKRGTLGSAAGGPEPSDSTKFKPMTAEEAAAALVARGPSGCEMKIFGTDRSQGRRRHDHLVTQEVRGRAGSLGKKLKVVDKYKDFGKNRIIE